jgi:hypothetical protein
LLCSQETIVERNPSDEVRDEDGGIHVDGIYIPPPPAPALTFEADGPRLVISHIENENFKSYAGKQCLGPFHKSFTSIVGPNGSGKSNVIDSMLFVFGYRAQKIRSKKIAVLIHDSDTHPDVRHCKVKVFFQVGFKVPFLRVKISIFPRLIKIKSDKSKPNAVLRREQL